TDGDGSLLAMWERHAVLFTLEGPDDEILVIRARPHGTVPPDWADRAYRVVNEWNHSRRFCKAYIGDPTERGQLPIYAEMQVLLGPVAQQFEERGVPDPVVDRLQQQRRRGVHVGLGEGVGMRRARRAGPAAQVAVLLERRGHPVLAGEPVVLDLPLELDPGRE